MADEVDLRYVQRVDLVGAWVDEVVVLVLAAAAAGAAGRQVDAGVGEA